MSRDDVVGKALGAWIGKAPKVGDPPKPSETRATLQHPERQPPLRDDDLQQLNFKIPAAMKKRIKQLALRDNLTLLAMLAEMVDLYEREYGRLPDR